MVYSSFSAVPSPPSRSKLRNPKHQQKWQRSGWRDIIDVMKHITQLTVAAIVETGLLCLLSYLLFVAGQKLLFGRSGRLWYWLWHLVRLPGNLLHELSHAVVLTLVGFKVTGLQVSLFDRREGRGAVYVAGRWNELIRADVAWALGAMAPLFGGIGALVLIAHLLHIPAGAGTINAASLGEAFVQRATTWIGALDFREPWTYAVLLLMFSIAAELAPSEKDLQSSLKVLLAMACLAAMGLAIVYSMPPTAPLRMAFDERATAVLRKVMAAQEMALSVVGGVGLMLAVPVLIIEAMAAEVEPAEAIRAPRAVQQRVAERRARRAVRMGRIQPPAQRRPGARTRQRAVTSRAAPSSEDRSRSV